MTRHRSYTSHLTAEYARQHPLRPTKTEFHDEILCAVAFLMRQIDPSGTKPVIEPSAYAEGAEPGPSVKPSSRGKGRDD